MYLHYSLKQKFLIGKHWIHTTFTDSYTFPFSFSKFWTMHPYTAVHSFKNWTIPHDPRSLVPVELFHSTSSFQNFKFFCRVHLLDIQGNYKTKIEIAVKK